jgi:hypothetical protein
MLLGPLIIRYFVGDKYDVGTVLFAAAIVVGYVRIWQSVAVASVSAMGDRRTISKLNFVGWVALAVAAAGAVALSGFGLPGVIYGIGLGWTFQAAVATRLAQRAFAQRWSAGYHEAEQGA